MINFITGRPDSSDHSTDMSYSDWAEIDKLICFPPAKKTESADTVAVPADSGQAGGTPLEFFQCHGCGRKMSNPKSDLFALQAEGFISCCPDRHIVDLSQVARA